MNHTCPSISSGIVGSLELLKDLEIPGLDRGMNHSRPSYVH